MTIKSDQADNYLYWEDTEEVAITFRRSGGDTCLVDIVVMRHNASRVRQVFGSASVTGDNLAFSVPNALLSSNEIQSGDKITDAAGVDYFVDQVSRFQFGHEWFCSCVRAQ